MEKRNFIMNYPVAYAVIPEEEKTYIVAAAMSSTRSCSTTSSATSCVTPSRVTSATPSGTAPKQSSFTPIANWFKNVDDMGVIAHLGYFYGFWHIWRDVKGYLG